LRFTIKLAKVVGMSVSKQFVDRFLHKEVAITFDDGGMLSFARGVIVSNDENGFILKYKNAEQFYSYDCIKRIREVWKGKEGDFNGR
jgi:hypothetical protein